MSEQNSEVSAENKTQTPNGSAGLEVAGEPGVFWCARHRKTQTRLRCGRCEAPICPKCTVYAPTGARCRNCASFRGTHLYQVSALQLLTTFALSAVLGLIGAFAIQFVFLLLLFAPALGGLLGNLITRVTKGKRGPVIASAASLGIATGTAAVFALRWMSLAREFRVLDSLPGKRVPTPELTMLLVMNSGALYALIFLALAVAGVWYWLR